MQNNSQKTATISISATILLSLSLAGCGDNSTADTDANVDAGVRDAVIADTRLDALAEGSVDAGQTDAPTLDASSDAQGDARLDADIAMGDTVALTSANRIVSFTRVSATIQSSITLSGIGAGETAVGIDFRAQNRRLYVMTRDTVGQAKLYAVDSGTGAVDANPLTLTGAALATGIAYAIDFNPAADALRIVGANGDNLRANLNTGAITTDAMLNQVPSGGGAAETALNIGGAAYTNAFDVTCRTQLFVIDPSTDTVKLQDPPNAGVLTSIGALGVNATAAIFDGITAISAQTAATNAGLAVLTVDGLQRLYDVSLTAGTANNARGFTGLGANETLLDIAVPTPVGTVAQAAGDYVGVTEDNRFVTFNRAAPRNFCTTSTVTGLISGEAVLGLDTRVHAALGQATIYGIGRTNNGGSGARLLSFNVGDLTAVTVTGSTLTSPSTGTAFAGIDAAAYAVDFNPAADLLRVIGSTGQNLRIVPPGRTLLTPTILEPGFTTFTDSTLTDGQSTSAIIGISAAAYTNNDTDSGTGTTLYAIDTTGDRLVRIGSDPGVSGACPATTGNPNCGVVSAVGSLGLSVDVVDANGFETSDANVARAVLRTTDANNSSFYDINLVTGAASNAAVIGSNGAVGTSNRLLGVARRTL